MSIATGLAALAAAYGFACVVEILQAGPPEHSTDENHDPQNHA